MEKKVIIPELQPIEPKEIMQGLTVEEMKATFFDADALIEPAYRVYQLNSKNHRYYYRYNTEGNPEFYPSVTTVLRETMPKSAYLEEWKLSKGKEEAERYMAERADYGTFMHIQFGELLITRKYDLDGLKGKLKDYIEAKNLPMDFIYNADDLKKDVLAFAQFIIDYDVKPLAIEIALVHPQKHYAGMIDLVCTMNSKIGGNERITAIIDFKSGRKAFYEEHELQLHMYKAMWQYNYEDKPIEKVFNFSPKDWRKKPTYNLKDQTNSENAAKLPALLEIAAIEDSKRENTFTSTFGEIDLDAGTQDLTANIISLSLADLIKTKTNKNE